MQATLDHIRRAYAELALASVAETQADAERLVAEAQTVLAEAMADERADRQILMGVLLAVIAGQAAGRKVPA